MKKQIIYDYSNTCTMITGAAGAIGTKLATDYANAHSHLILLDLLSNQEQVEQFAQELRAAYDICVSTYYANICNLREVESMVDVIRENHESIDILINNVGVNRIIPALKLTEEDWDTVVDTNLKGTFLMCRLIGEIMVQRRSGVIINISSQHGVVANDCRVPYCASKAGIIHMSKSFAFEWSKFGVRVNCVSPTFVISDKNDEYLEQPAIKRKYLSKIPLGRYCTPEDVSASVMFLSSDAASMITGHNLIVDGGYTIV